MSNINYDEEKRVLSGFIEWPKIYSGAKTWEYEMIFDAEFGKIVNGSIYQYEENGDYFDCYPLCDEKLPNEHFMLKTDRLNFNQTYFDSLDHQSEADTKDLEKMQHDSLMTRPKTHFNLTFLGDNYGRSYKFNSVSFIKSMISVVDAVFHRINIDSPLHRKLSPQKTCHAIKYLDQGDEGNSDEGYLSSS